MCRTPRKRRRVGLVMVDPTSNVRIVGCEMNLRRERWMEVPRSGGFYCISLFVSSDTCFVDSTLETLLLIGVRISVVASMSTACFRFSSIRYSNPCPLP